MEGKVVLTLFINSKYGTHTSIFTLTACENEWIVWW